MLPNVPGCTPEWDDWAELAPVNAALLFRTVVSALPLSWGRVGTGSGHCPWTLLGCPGKSWGWQPHSCPCRVVLSPFVEMVTVLLDLYELCHQEVGPDCMDSGEEVKDGRWLRACDWVGTSVCWCGCGPACPQGTPLSCIIPQLRVYACQVLLVGFLTMPVRCCLVWRQTVSCNVSLFPSLSLPHWSA